MRQQASKCQFGSNAQEATEINLKDKIVDNWATVELKKKLLEKERSLKEIIELCQVHEQIGNQSAVMNVVGSEPSTSCSTVNKLNFRSRQQVKDLCTRCGKPGHSKNVKDCPAIRAECRKCGLIGHFAFHCRTRVKKRPTSPNSRNSKRKRFNVNWVEVKDSNSPPETKNFECFKINDRRRMSGPNVDDGLVQCVVGGVLITVLIDSGSRVNIIKGEDWNRITKNKAVVWDIDPQTNDVLNPYGSEQPLKIKHRFQTTINTPGAPETITHFYVVEKGEIFLLGKETAKQIGVLKIGTNINQISQTTTFSKNKNVIVKLTIDPDVKPVKQPLRRIPISVETLVEEKLSEALKKDIIEKVTEPSAWISPIVVIFKPDGDIRICVDMRRANQAILRETTHYPTFDGIMAKLRNAKYFSRLDLEKAYHQLELDKESRPITTFITFKGMFRYKRLMFGVNSGPEIFQREFEGILASCENCINYLDDVIVYGSSEAEHDACLKKVLQVLEENHVLLNKKKCTMKVQEVEFLGHKLSSKGIDADKRKVISILNFRAPATKEEL